MSETRQQRSFGIVVAIFAAIAGLAEFRNVSSEDLLLAAMLLLAGALAGFGIMHARERWLQKSGRRPLDKPSSSVLVPFYLLILGLVGLFRLLSPPLRVGSYGVMLGVMLGFIVYIGRDIQRLRPSPTAQDPDE
jgi:amino acid transporter